METTDVAALASSVVEFLSTTQLLALGTAQVAGITTRQLTALTTLQFVSFTTVQVGAFSSSQVAALTTDDAYALTTQQLQALSTTDLAALSTLAMQTLRTMQLTALATTQVAALTSRQANALSTTQVVAFTTAQILSMTTSDVRALSTTQVFALATNQLRALATNQIRALATSQLRAMGTTQVKALATVQTHALTTTQVAALTTSQVAVYSTPIVLDLNGDGVHTLGLSAGVQFDLLAKGAKVQTGWVGGGDGLLALDRNHDGTINDGSELFGSSTVLADGTRASDGYVALGELDSNHDGVISAADAAFGDLRVWVDGNADGTSSAAELRTLDSLGITEISLTTQAGSSTDNGNILGLTSSFRTADGSSHAAADVWFQIDPASSQGVSLGDKVSTLAQAIGVFDPAPTSVAPTAMAGVAPSGASAVASGTLAVTDMVEAMRRFDSTSLQVAGSQSAVSATRTASEMLASPVLPSGAATAQEQAQRLAQFGSPIGVAPK